MAERPQGVPGLVEGALDQGRRAATGLIDGFRRAGRWQRLRLGLVGGQQILVRNESEEVWTDIVLTLDRTWRNEQRSLRPREQVVLSPAQFERGGEPAPRDLRPRRLDVECKQGSARFELR